MPYASSAYSTAEAAAYARDCPLICAHNVLRDAIDLRWQTSGSLASATDDLVTPTRPVRNAYDGRATAWTSATATLSTVYLCARIPPSTIDTIALIFTRAFLNGTVTVQIADDGAFSTNLITFAGPFTDITGLPRLVRSFNGTRYINVEYIRLRFVKTSGTWSSALMPKLAEWFVGRGRVLGLDWGYGSDEAPDRAEVAEFEARSGEKTRYVFHRGKRDLKHSQLYSMQNFSGLDDVATLRTIATESLDYKRPVLYVPRPNTALNNALLGYLPKEGLKLDQQNFDGYEHVFDFQELPMYRMMETTA